MPGGIITTARLKWVMQNKIKNAAYCQLNPDGSGFIGVYKENAPSELVRALEWKTERELDEKLEAIQKNQPYKPPKKKK